MTSESITPWPKAWAPLAGTRVTVEGTALDAKMGAILAGDGVEIWIDGRDSWPDGYYHGCRNGRRVRVSGLVIVRDDLPVFVPEKGEPQRAGMPVPAGTDLAQACRRYLLSEARWTPLD